MSKSRDDFSKPTVCLIGQRAGYICAFPGCNQLTIGPSDDRVSGISMVGIAAHITAASSRGPRYDTTITPEERSSEANGIWMCQVHGKLIDDTQSTHTTDQLKRWKKQHEEWVFARVACADSTLKHGITSISINRIGPFRESTTISLGQHNVVFGSNGSGKSSLCESIAAFSGGKNFESFCNRWSLFGERSPGMSIEASISVNGSRTTVLLSEEATALKNVLKRHQTRLHVEVNGNVSAHWPRSLFNVIYLDKPELKPNSLKNGFRRDLRALAAQFGLDEDQVWDALREELFCNSTFGSRIRRVGAYLAEVRTTGSQHFLPAEAISGSERLFTLFDIMLRMIRTDPRPTPWVIIVDSSYFLGLDTNNKRRLVKALNTLDKSDVQTIVCVNSQEEAITLTAEDTERWIGSSTAGTLTVHAFI